MDLMNAIPRFSFLTPEHCDVIHQATLDILRRTGVQFHHQESIKLLKETGAMISNENLVRFPPSLVEWALAQAPSTVTLCKRGSNKPVLRMEGMNVHFGTGSDCLNYLDPRSGRRRLATSKDIIDCIRLVDALPEIEFCMSMVIPSDLDAINPFKQQFALMLQHTSKPIVFISGDKDDCEAIVAMAAAAAGGMEALCNNPTLLAYTQATTPLVQPAESMDKLLYLAEVGIPIVHQPSPMMGATAPVTMAGALALGNAEILSALVVHQLKRTGAPFIYGNGLHHMDMKTTISVYGAPEFELARVAVAEMGRYYNLPHWGYAGYTDSCAMDEQAISEAASSILMALLSGQHLAHDIGYIEAGLTFSPELVVFSAETIDRLRHFVGGITIDEESLALELIDRVGPGGNFLTTKHTLRHFREFWRPTLFSRDRWDEWANRGSTTLGWRLREKTLAILDKHEPDMAEGSLIDEINYILEKSQRAN